MGKIDKLDYKVYSSGSQGNMVRVGNILIDCGLKVGDVKVLISENEDIVNCDYLVITHRHSDHIEVASLIELIHNTNIHTLITSQDVIDKVDSKLLKLKKQRDSFQEFLTDIPKPFKTEIIELTNTYEDCVYPITFRSFVEYISTLCTFKCVHDVPTFGFTLTFDDSVLLYATDTKTMKNFPHKGDLILDSGGKEIEFDGYDYLFIEANYDEYTVDGIIKDNNPKSLARVLQNTERHLSKTQAKKFAIKNLKDNGKFFALHKSKDFYGADMSIDELKGEVI